MPVRTGADTIQRGTDLVEPNPRSFQLGNQVSAFDRQRRTLRIVLVVGCRVARRLEDGSKAGRQRLDQCGGTFPLGDQCIAGVDVLTRVHSAPIRRRLAQVPQKVWKVSLNACGAGAA